MDYKHNICYPLKTLLVIFLYPFFGKEINKLYHALVF